MPAPVILAWTGVLCVATGLAHADAEAPIAKKEFPLATPSIGRRRPHRSVDQLALRPMRQPRPLARADEIDCVTGAETAPLGCTGA
jgi:hypothetical protein